MPTSVAAVNTISRSASAGRTRCGSRCSSSARRRDRSRPSATARKSRAAPRRRKRAGRRIAAATSFIRANDPRLVTGDWSRPLVVAAAFAAALFPPLVGAQLFGGDDVARKQLAEQGKRVDALRAQNEELAA